MKLKLLFGLGAVAALAALGIVDPGAARPGGVAVAPETPPQRLTRWPMLESWLAGSRIGWRAKTGEPRLPERQLVVRGRSLFGLYCVQCHGAEGRGDGPRAPVFHPAPRNLRSGIFKYRSTPAGDPPTRADLFRTISNGLRGTGMAAFADLPEKDRWALVEYVRTLSPVFAAPPAKPLARPPAPSDLGSSARIARGQASFARLGCGSCHGNDGAGDGPAAASLRLSGHPPRNFRSEPLRTGNDPDMVYRTLLTGLEGTPMPAHPGTPPDELWDLTAYVLSLADKETPGRTAAAQQGQARHAVVQGCGCQARR
jgi:mono/diheme cytochrome c family protein